MRGYVRIRPSQKITAVRENVVQTTAATTDESEIRSFLSRSPVFGKTPRTLSDAVGATFCLYPPVADMMVRVVSVGDFIELFVEGRSDQTRQAARISLVTREAVGKMLELTSTRFRKGEIIDAWLEEDNGQLIGVELKPSNLLDKLWGNPFNSIVAAVGVFTAALASTYLGNLIWEPADGTAGGFTSMIPGWWEPVVGLSAAALMVVIIGLRHVGEVVLDKAGLRREIGSWHWKTS